VRRKILRKSNDWEENKVTLPGEALVIRVDRGRWFITEQPAKARLVTRLVDARCAGVGRGLRVTPFRRFRNAVSLLQRPFRNTVSAITS
jgi:hypothetical protein